MDSCNQSENNILKMSSVELDDETKKILASLSGVLEVTAAPKLEQRDPLAIPFYKVNLFLIS